ncbi:MAG: winged helix-turn-helix transcriptional regulator [Clostridiales bacterium]|nr:winged helix-turn-helix transcriptional regulator [Clostridiales bacterium]
MEYDERMGIAYDTIFYGILCFNFERIKESFQRSSAVLHEDFRHFYQLKATLPEPPPELYPFFYCDTLHPSFLAKQFYEDFYFGQEEFTSFWERFLLKSPQQLAQLVFEYYYNEYQTETDCCKDGNVTQTIYQAFQLNLDHELTLQLIYLLLNPDTVVHALTTFLTASYHAVCELFRKETRVIQGILKIFTNNHFLDHLNVLPNGQYIKNSKKDRLSISFLNFLIVLQKGTEETGHKFLLGRCCHTYCNSESNYYKISPQVLCEAVGNPVNSFVLQLLNEQELTVTQLSDKLIMARQTVNRHVLWLLDLMLIKIAKVTNTQIYYRINRDFFTVAKEILSRYFTAFETGTFQSTGDGTNENMEKAENV